MAVLGAHGLLMALLVTLAPLNPLVLSRVGGSLAAAGLSFVCLIAVSPGSRHTGEAPATTIRLGLLHTDNLFDRAEDLGPYIRTGARERFDLIVAPEGALTSIPMASLSEVIVAGGLQRQASQLLLGAYALDGELGHRFNVAALFNAGSGNLDVAIYKKRRLTPLGETPLWRSKASGRDHVRMIAGHSPMSFRVGDATVSVAICFEAFFADFLRRDPPSDLIAVLSDHKSVATQLLWEQTERLYRVLALQLGRTVLVAANTNYSLVVDPSGKIIHRQNEPGIGLVEISVGGRQTAFAVAGTWACLFLSYAFLMLFVVMWRKLLIRNFNPSREVRPGQ